MSDFDLFVALAGVAASVYLATLVPWTQSFFRLLPPVVWLYFVPMGLTTADVLPSEASLYSALAAYALPFALLFLTMSLDLKAIMSVGRLALIGLMVGALGIALGCVLALLIVGSWLPESGWKGLSMLSATWIGGSANMLSIQQSLSAPAETMGPIVVVDTVLGYGWLSVLILMSGWQSQLDRRFGAREEQLERLADDLRNDETQQRTLDVTSIVIFAGFGLFAAWGARRLGGILPEIGNPTIISPATWTILIVVTAGLVLSQTRIGELSRSYGTPAFAYAALYMLLTTIGAQADLRALTQAPVYVAAGAIILMTHIAIMFIAAKALRMNTFILASASMANIGGAVSAPIAAAAYRPALAPVGALLGVAGYIIGIYVPLAVAQILGILAL